MDPINYTVAVANPIENALKGYQAGLGVTQLQQEQQAQQAAAAQKQQMQADLAQLSANPSTQAIAAMSIKYPQLSEQFKRSFDMLEPTKRQAKLTHASQVYSAVLSGRSDIAADLLKKQAEGYRNAGDEAEAQASETWAKLVTDHPETVKRDAGLMLSSVMGEKFAETFGKLGAEQRAQELQPDAVREGKAKADSAVSDATIKAAEAEYAPETAKAKAQGVVADTKTKEVTAKYAEREKQAELKQAAAQLGLTGAQTSSALASAQHMRAETQKTVLEVKALKQNGGVPSEKRFALESDLRKEYSTQTKHFTDVKEAFTRIKSAENTGAGDIALVYSYMKILDPTSVVREGEFATAQNSAGIPAAVVAAYNKAINGERLTKGQRDSFVSQGQKLLNAAGVREKEVRKGIEQIAGNYNLNTKNIYFNDAAIPDQSAKAAPPAKPAATAKPKNVVVDF